MNIQPKFRAILDQCEPYIISYTGNWPTLDLAPCGIEIPPTRYFTATSLKSTDVIDRLHRLDSATFGDQNMAMPRWVLFDCGEFPGLVFGFGCKARQLPDYAREFYAVEEQDDAFVPLSMWVAIRCAEDKAWFGHNLSSANLILRNDDSLPGLALLTKIFGTIVARAQTLYGATQWRSQSIGIHQKLGEMEVLSAYTPAHTHAETFAYRINIDNSNLTSKLATGFVDSQTNITRSFAANDVDAMLKLQQDLETGRRFAIVRADVKPHQSGLIHLREL